MATGTVIHARFATRTAASAPARGVWATLAAVLRASRTRRLLAEMDDRMLADIGIDRGQAHMEATRALWDLAPRR